MQERKGNLPGYTGHIPSAEVSDVAAQRVGPRSHIPNYRGFIPGVKSENLFGKTYGNITEASALGTYNKGRDVPKEEKYKTVTQDSYTNQLRIPVMPLKPKQYPEPPAHPLSRVEAEAFGKFYGSHPGISQEEVEMSAKTFFGPPGFRSRQQAPPVDLGISLGKFMGEDNLAGNPNDIPDLTYEEARQIANQIRQQQGA